MSGDCECPNVRGLRVSECPGIAGQEASAQGRGGQEDGLNTSAQGRGGQGTAQGRGGQGTAQGRGGQEGGPVDRSTVFTRGAAIENTYGLPGREPYRTGRPKGGNNKQRVILCRSHTCSESFAAPLGLPFKLLLCGL